MSLVYVQDVNGKPLMPTKRFGKVRRLLDDNKAKAIQRKPFTIRLTYQTTTHKQPLVLGMDEGSKEIGISVVGDKREVFAANVELVQGIKDRLEKRSKLRRNRRSKLRHREERIDNRKSSKPKGWLAPSIKHGKDSHIRFIEKKVSTILPITSSVVETGNFDIQKIKNPTIEGKKYQQGEQYGFWNLREYIFHRDEHKCQNPKCNNKGYDHKVNGKKKKAKPLQVHHIGYWKKDRSNRPSNLITLCTSCHTPTKHKKGNLLWGWQPKLNSFRDAAFMNIVRWIILNELRGIFPRVNFANTYGYITKSKRIELGLEKSHVNDAFVIAGGTSQTRCKPYKVKQIKRNSRSVEKFYDAKYMDIRDNKVKSGQDLADQRRSRQKDVDRVNLRQYRGHKTRKGSRRIRKQRYPFQPYDTAIYIGKKRDNPTKCQVKGTMNKGKTVQIIAPNGDVINSSYKDVQHYSFGKGFCFL